MPEYDLVLSGGKVVDPEANEIFDAEVAIASGKIAAISRQRGQLRGGQIIDVTGQLVTPGLVDTHVHVFHHISPGSLDPDAIGVRQGVCAVIDAGSFGPRNAPGFHEFIVKPATTHVYGLVNISRQGNSNNPGEGEVLGFLNPNETARAVTQNAGWIVGVKARASNTASGLLGTMSTRLAKVAAREAGVPLMVHVGNGPPTLEEVCSILSAGDLITHCFHGKIGGSVTRQGTMLPEVVAAIERGVLLDVGHGAASFAWDTGEKALALGYKPDIISTDLHQQNVDGPVYSLVKTMSKFVHLGMSMVEVVRAASTAAANAFSLGDRYGRIAEGFPANLSVVEMVNRTETMTDSEGKTRQVTGVIEARYTILDGTLHQALADATALKREAIVA